MILDWHPSLRVVNATLFTLRPPTTQPSLVPADRVPRTFEGNLFQWMTPVQLASYLRIRQYTWHDSITMVSTYISMLPCVNSGAAILRAHRTNRARLGALLPEVLFHRRIQASHQPSRHWLPNWLPKRVAFP